MPHAREVDSCHYLRNLVTVDIEDAPRFEAIERISAERFGPDNLDDLLPLLGTRIEDPEVLEAYRATLTQILEETPIYRVDDPIQVTNDSEETAAPIYAVGFEGHSGYMPGTPAVEVQGQIMPASGEVDGIICVIDSGIVKDDLLPDWMKGQWVDKELNVDIEQLGGGELASHGTFVVGNLRKIAPNHKVFLAKAQEVEAHAFDLNPPDLQHDSAGAPNPTTEIEVRFAVDRLLRRLGKTKPSALNLSLGAYRCGQGGNHMKIMKMAIETWTRVHKTPEQDGSCAIFAAGGNSPRPEPVYPAEFPEVRGVGAAKCGDPDDKVWDDNSTPIDHGPNKRLWISDVAPGARIINLSGTVKRGSNPSEPLVEWSGSSFSSAIACAMWVNDQRLRDPLGVWWPDKQMDCGQVPNLSYFDAAGSPHFN